MPKVRVGDVICTDYGTGPIVAITKEWIIHKSDMGDDASEVALSRNDEFWSLPDDSLEVGGGQELEAES